jgi:hypothetical protein
MYGKFFLRGENIDLVFMGERSKVIEEANRIAAKHATSVEVWPDPSNDDYVPLAVCCALPPTKAEA